MNYKNLKNFFSILVAIFFLTLFLLTAIADAQPEKTSFKGETITLIASSSPGGGTDTWARLIASHLVRHIPGNPHIVVTNMPGAGGMIALNHLYNRAKPDGLTMTTANRGTVLGPIMSEPGLQFKAERFIWVGQGQDNIDVIYVRSNTPFTSIEAIKKANQANRRPKMGVQAKTHSGNVNMRFLEEIFKIDFDIIYGYPGTPEILLDIERGALDGRSQGLDSIMITRRHWIESGFITPLLILRNNRVPALPKTPTLLEITPVEKKFMVEALQLTQIVGGSIVLPPGVPSARVQVLRDAFALMVEDPQFVKEGERLGLAINLTRGEDMNRAVESLFKNQVAIDLFRKILTE